jgi:hypothetical protein
LFLIFLKPEKSETATRSFLPVLLTHHLVEFFLFLARFLPFLAYYIARYVAWMESAPKVVVGESGSILRTDCRVRASLIEADSYLMYHSLHNILPNGQYHTNILKNVYYASENGSRKSPIALMEPTHISL